MDYGTAGTALAVGILFGFVLEQAGFGSPCKLTAQFRLTDWSVFKVMFTAIITAAIGILLLQINNTFGAQTFFIAEAHVWALVTGAALIGAGFAIGGYCPGTSVVGLGSGRIDGLIFMLGMVIGVLAFSSVYDSAVVQGILDSFHVEALTMYELLGISPWTMVMIMAGMLVAGYLVGRGLESKSHGVYSAEDLMADRNPARSDDDIGRSLAEEAHSGDEHKQQP